MYPFPSNVTPSVQEHLQAQVSMFNDISKAFFRSIKNVVDANITLAGTLLEEGNEVGKDLLTANSTTERISSLSKRSQPISQKLSAYQNQISQVAADSQKELAQTVSDHAQETSRTSQALAEEVKRSVVEQTEQNKQKFEEATRNFADPFKNAGKSGGNAQQSRAAH